MKSFIICQKFSWNSLYPIWDVIMNLTEMIYTEISENKATVFFYRRKKNPHAEIVEDPC